MWTCIEVQYSPNGLTATHLVSLMVHNISLHTVSSLMCPAQQYEALQQAGYFMQACFKNYFGVHQMPKNLAGSFATTAIYFLLNKKNTKII